MSLDSEDVHQLLEWGIDWHRNIGRDAMPDEFSAGEPSSSLWARHRSRYAFQKLARETFPLYDLEITPGDIELDVMTIIQDLALEFDHQDDWDRYHYPVEESIEEDGLVATYQAKVNHIIARIGQGGQLETIFYFPLNMVWTEELPELEIFDISFRPVTDSEWAEQLAAFKEYPETFNIHMVESLCEDADYTYWKAIIQSKGRQYASNKVNTAVNLLCAKINYSQYCWETQWLSERGRSSAGSPRWLWVQEPCAVLTASEDRPLEVAIVDQGPRRTVELDWTDPNTPVRFEQIPSFEYGADGLAGRLQDALLEYQRAMVETEPQNAFFAFWRCIEGLSLARQGEKNEIVDRAMWALSIVVEEADKSFLKTITEQLYTIRNKWVHKANWRDIWGVHERAAKYLADTMISLYIEGLYRLDESVAEKIFQHARMEVPQREEKHRQAKQRLQALDELRDLEGGSF